MADSSRPDFFDNQPESSGTSNDDFEKLDAPGSGFDNDGGDADGPADAGAYDYRPYGDELNQDAEISTTGFPGEEEAEEDRYAGASEADAHTFQSEPLISLGDDDPFQFQTSASGSSPPVSEISQSDPLIDFTNPTGNEPDILATFASANVPSSTFQEPFSAPINPSPHNAEIVESESQGKKSKEGTECSSEDAAQEKDMSEIQPAPTKLEKKRGKRGCWLKGVDPRVKDLIYWRDVKTTGVVFGSMMVVLLSLAIFSLLSVVAYLSLACLAVTFTFVVYKKIMAAVQKSGDGHPFKPLLEMEIDLKEEKVKCVMQQVLKNVNATISEVRRLFLIEDLVDSIKFGLLLWVFTYIGSWFNGMTLIIIAVVLLFTLPKVYETYQVQIDQYLGMAKAQVDNVLQIVQSKVPFLKKKEKPQ